MTIDKATVTGETATDQIYYQSNLYVFYNHSGSVGDIAKVDMGANTIDPDWGSTVPTGAGTLQSAPHYAIYGDGVVYFTNGQYIGYIASATLVLIGLDFGANSQTVSVSWNTNRVVIAVNRPNVAGSNFNKSFICNWNGVSSSIEGDPVEVNGQIGAIYTKNGVTYVWWKDAPSLTAAYCFGYIEGTQIKMVERYSGALPNQAQVGEYAGYVAWLSGNEVFLWGAAEPTSPATFFKYMKSSLATGGAIGMPFGQILISGTDGATAYNLAVQSGYTTSAVRRSINFSVSRADYVSQIDLIKVETEQLASGAKADFTLTYNKGKSTKSLTQIAYSASVNKTRHKILNKGPANVEDFRLDINWANGSASNPVKIRKVFIKGHYVKSD
jgi:hypothetical protein